MKMPQWQPSKTQRQLGAVMIPTGGISRLSSVAGSHAIARARVADEETRTLITKMGIRKVGRAAGIHTNTITLIARGHRVKPRTLDV
jgi:hypothetical protein